MSSPGPRRWRRVLAVAFVLLAGGIAAAAVILASPGGPAQSATTFIPTLEKRPKLPPIDPFVWPFYGYNAAHTRSFAGPPRLGPPLRRGWSYNDFVLLEFPPVMYHQTLYFLDFDGRVKAIDKANGHLVWQRKVGTLAAASPAVDPVHKLLFVPTLSDTPNAHLPGNGRVAALSLSSGRIVWSHPLPPGSETSPLVHGASVFVGDQDGTVYSFRAATGHVNWTFQASGAVKGGVAWAAGNIYFGDYASRAYAVNAATGREQWATTTDGGGGTFYGSPAVAFGRVFLGNTDDHVYAFSERTGQLLWDTATSAYVYSSPAFANVGGLGRTVYVGSYDGNFYALNANTGAIRWRHSSGSPISGSGTIIGHVIYYSLLRVKNTLGLDLRSGRVVFSFPDGEFASVIADRSAIYLVGYSTIHQLLPRRAP